MIRDIIIERLNVIKSEEDMFKSSWWNDIYVSYSKYGYEEIKKNTWITSKNDVPSTVHVSEIYFNVLKDDDLVRIFEFILLIREQISSNRVNKIYFDK